MAIKEVLTGALATIASARQIYSQYPEARLRDVTDEAPRTARTDGWVNTAAGFGTSRDKSGGSYFQADNWLTDAELTDLFNHHDLAAKVVIVPVREAFKGGFTVGGLDDADKLEDVRAYLKKFNLLTLHKAANTWSRLYGGAVHWYRMRDGKDPREPFTGSAIVDAIEVIDRRHVFPFRYYLDGPKAGRPETYQVWVPRNGGAPVLMGEIHETRLVRFKGAPTEAQQKLRLQGWDQSVLQRPYAALQGAGNVWKAIEILTVDANQAVYGIKGLWRMIVSDPTQQQDSVTGNGPSGGLLNRIRFMDLMRSVSRAIVLDADDETFERKPTTFTGLPDIGQAQWTRVAAACDIPLPLITGEYPSGLNSTGEGPFRVFYATVASEQKEDYGPAILDGIKILLQSPEAPKLTEGEIEQLEICWPPLWEPSAKELSEIRVARANEGQILRDNQVITPEQWALSLPEDWGWAIDRERVAQAVEDLANAPDEDQGASTLVLTPSDIAAVVTVNQALASVGLPPMSGADGNMTVEAYRAKAAAEGEAEGAPPEPKPAPGAPSAGGFPPKGPTKPAPGGA